MPARQTLPSWSVRPFWRKLASFGVAILVALLMLGSGSARAEIGQVQGWDLSQASEALVQGPVSLRHAPQLREEAQSLLKHIPSWWAELEEELGQDVDDQLTIHFVTHAGQVAAATGMPKWVAGVANGARGEIAIAYHSPDGSRSDLASLLRHEMAHVALRRAVQGASMPRWFHEGVADSLGADIDLGRANTLAAAAFGVGIPPLEQWDYALMSQGEAVSNAYAASRDFVKHLRYYDDEGQRFRRLISRLAKGERFERAVSLSYPKALAGLFEEWNDSLRDRFFWYALMASSSLPMMLCAPLLVVAWRKKKKEKDAALAAMELRERQAWERKMGWDPSGMPGRMH